MGLKTKSYEEQLKKLGTFSQEKRKFKQREGQTSTRDDAVASHITESWGKGIVSPISMILF